MNKMIVTVFDDESVAYEGVRALKGLYAEGSLTLYATAVVAKDPTGAVSVKQEADMGPLGTTLGLATGAFIGLLGGPVGVAVGGASGILAGSVFDLARIGINADFVEEVSVYLVPGKVAVIAEVDEEWVTPLDARMGSLGGTVFRRVRGEYIEDQIERDLAADRAELAELKAEFQRAAGDTKATLQAKIDAAERKLQARREQMKETIAAINREGEAKIATLHEQAAKAKGEAKAKLERRVTETRARHEARTSKLNQAWQLVKEAAAI
jgi:uncharacterized membrane protein